MPRVLVTDGIQQVGLDVLTKRQDVVVDRVIHSPPPWRGPTIPPTAPRFEPRKGAEQFPNPQLRSSFVTPLVHRCLEELLV